MPTSRRSLNEGRRSSASRTKEDKEPRENREKKEIREDVIFAFNSACRLLKEYQKNIPAAEGQRKERSVWVMNAIDHAAKTSIDVGQDTIEVKNPADPTQPGQKEGVPVNDLIDFLEFAAENGVQLKDENIPPNDPEIIRLGETLLNHSENYFLLHFGKPAKELTREESEQQHWRTQLEASYISQDYRQTGSMEGDYQLAMKVMANRRELILPPEEPEEPKKPDEPADIDDAKDAVSDDASIDGESTGTADNFDNTVDNVDDEVDSAGEDESGGAPAEIPTEPFTDIDDREKIDETKKVRPNSQGEKVEASDNLNRKKEKKNERTGDSDPLIPEEPKPEARDTGEIVEFTNYPPLKSFNKATGEFTFEDNTTSQFNLKPDAKCNGVPVIHFSVTKDPRIDSLFILSIRQPLIGTNNNVDLRLEARKGELGNRYQAEINRSGKILDSGVIQIADKKEWVKVVDNYNEQLNLGKAEIEGNDAAVNPDKPEAKENGDLVEFTNYPPLKSFNKATGEFTFDDDTTAKFDLTQDDKSASAPEIRFSITKNPKSDTLFLLSINHKLIGEDNHCNLQLEARKEEAGNRYKVGIDRSGVIIPARIVEIKDKNEWLRLTTYYNIQLELAKRNARIEAPLDQEEL